MLAVADRPAVAVCDLERVDDLDPCAVVASPAPGVAADERRAVVDAAVRAVDDLRARGVVAVQVRTGRPPRAAAVRCALPVEHPLAALLAGVDLVEEQLRAAADEPPAWGSASGTSAVALLLRVYALDVGAEGARITRWAEPAGVRVDSGCREGDVVPAWYDPLLATLTVDAPTAGEALARAQAAVRELVVEGPRTNLPQLAAVLDDPSFAAA